MRGSKQCGPSAIYILHFLVESIDKTNGCILTHNEISEECECSISTVQRTLKALEKCNYIKHKRTGKASAYQINAKIVTKIHNFKELSTIGYELFDDEITEREFRGRNT